MDYNFETPAFAEMFRQSPTLVKSNNSGKTAIMIIFGFALGVATTLVVYRIYKDYEDKKEKGKA